MSVKGVKITGFIFFDSSIRLLLEVKLDNEKRTPGVKPGASAFFMEICPFWFSSALYRAGGCPTGRPLIA